MGLLDGFDWAAHGARLRELYADAYKEIFGLAYADANGELSTNVSFDVSNPAIKRALDRLGKEITGVANTTRDDIMRLVDRQTEEGWSMGELAKAILEQGDINSVSRAAMIARTESATAYNVGATYAYEDAGVTHVEVFDGDGDAECAAANGQTWTLDEARANPIAHPNCLRAFGAIVE